MPGVSSDRECTISNPMRFLFDAPLVESKQPNDPGKRHHKLIAQVQHVQFPYGYYLGEIRISIIFRFGWGCCYVTDGSSALCLVYMRIVEMPVGERSIIVRYVKLFWDRLAAVGTFI